MQLSHKIKPPSFYSFFKGSSPTDRETRMFYGIVVAPSYTAKDLEVLKRKSDTLRIFEAENNDQGKLSLRNVGGGWLIQN